MAAPLSSIAQQQIPLSQPFQPGGSDQTREIRQRGQEPRETELQARGAAPSQSQHTNSTDNNKFQQKLGSVQNSINNEQGDPTQGRGKVIDIIV